jgi:hypothetical protein
MDYDNNHKFSILEVAEEDYDEASKDTKIENWEVYDAQNTLN